MVGHFTTPVRKLVRETSLLRPSFKTGAGLEEHRLFDHQGMFLGSTVRGDFCLEALAHDTIVDVNLTLFCSVDLRCITRRAVDASWTCTVLLWQKISFYQDQQERVLRFLEEGVEHTS